MKLHAHLFAIALLSLITSACNMVLFGNENCIDCNNVPCTKEFKAISIQVKDANNTAIQLAAFNVFYSKNKEEISNSTFEQGWSAGSYLIANDAMLKILDCKGTSITFEYSIDGINFDEENFLVGKDCCHIQWRDKKEPTIIIK